MTRRGSNFQISDAVSHKTSSSGQRAGGPLTGVTARGGRFQTSISFSDGKSFWILHPWRIPDKRSMRSDYALCYSLSQIIRSFASIQLQLIGRTTFSNARSLLGGCDGHQFSAWFLVTRNEPAQGLGLAIDVFVYALTHDSS